MRPTLARKAGAAGAAKFAGVTQSAWGPPSVKSKRRADLRSSLDGRPLDGSAGAAGRTASRIGGSFEVTSRAMGRASLPSCRSIDEIEPGGAVASTFDERDDAVKAMLAMAIAACRKAGKYAGICGQGPSDHPELAQWLVDQHIESISLNPDTVVATWLLLAGKNGA